jgi:hypothetical protein
MSGDFAFTIVDTSGNTLRFDGFACERSVEAARGDWHDANWLRCNITLHAGIEHSVAASLLTTELRELSEILQPVYASEAETKRTFEPLEPYIELLISRSERRIDVLARLDLHPALGPVIEFNYECRPAEITLTVEDIERVRSAYPERNTQMKHDVGPGSVV